MFEVPVLYVILYEPIPLLYIFRYCGVQNPSWAELHHFVQFLTTQLNDFRANTFLGAAAADILPGFSEFALKFLIQMSKVSCHYTTFLLLFLKLNLICYII